MTAREAAARLYHHARAEAVFVVVVWALALLWTVGTCYLYGYQHDADSWVVRTGLARVRTPNEFSYYAGFPDWVLLGIIAPWLACTAITVFFCLFGMKDDDLGTEAEEKTDVGH